MRQSAKSGCKQSICCERFPCSCEKGPQLAQNEWPLSLKGKLLSSKMVPCKTVLQFPNVWGHALYTAYENFMCVCACAHACVCLGAKQIIHSFHIGTGAKDKCMGYLRHVSHPVASPGHITQFFWLCPHTHTDGLSMRRSVATEVEMCVCAHTWDVCICS